MIAIEVLVSVLIGIGLAAASGFRVFVPALILSLAARAGVIELNPSFGWIASDAALVALLVATLVEVGAYLVPWVDHLLDIGATPAAVVAGTIVTASVLTDLPPFMVWSMAVIGGGTAGLVQAGSVVARGASTLTTGGLGNPLIAIGESVGSVLLSAIAILAPLAVVLVVIAIVAAIFWGRPKRRVA